jgi:hypothetical protein
MGHRTEQQQQQLTYRRKKLRVREENVEQVQA